MGAKAKPPAPAGPAATTGACSTYYGQNQQSVPPAYDKSSFSTFICGYTPKQIQSAYGLADLADFQSGGRGQTVAIIDAYASPTMRSDINTYSKTNGLPAMTEASYKEIVPSQGEVVDQASCSFPSGWQCEEALEVDPVHGTAPRCQHRLRWRLQLRGRIGRGDVPDPGS